MIKKFVPMLYGILASFFFSSAFIMNRAMELSGGNWLWSVSLRYLFMLPILLVIVLIRGNLQPLLMHMKRHLWHWMRWSLVGFGLFYVPLCFSAAYGPGWLIASTWQITIVAGSLVAPLFYKIVMTSSGPMKVREPFPLKGLLMSLVILVGVGIMQIEHASQLSVKEVVLGIVPVMIAAFAYPVGNRKMMRCARTKSIRFNVC
jgi:drug/metabolite transporter (DMT)-like permease